MGRAAVMRYDHPDLVATIPPATPTPAAVAEPNLDELTKDELIAHAQTLGISPAHQGMTKEELRAAIDQA